MGAHNDIILLWGLGIDAWITIATVMAVLAMLLFRCCTINQAMDSVNWRALMSLAGSIVLGMAISKTGIAQTIAFAVINMVGTQPVLIMLGVCLAAMLITQLVENVAVILPMAWVVPFSSALIMMGSSKVSMMYSMFAKLSVVGFVITWIPCQRWR